MWRCTSWHGSHYISHAIATGWSDFHQLRTFDTLQTAAAQLLLVLSHHPITRRLQPPVTAVALRQSILCAIHNCPHGHPWQSDKIKRPPLFGDLDLSTVIFSALRTNPYGVERVLVELFCDGFIFLTDFFGRDIATMFALVFVCHRITSQRFYHGAARMTRSHKHTFMKNTISCKYRITKVFNLRITAHHVSAKQWG